MEACDLVVSPYIDHATNYHDLDWQKMMVQEYLMVYGRVDSGEITQALDMSVRRVNRFLLELEMDNVIKRNGSVRKPVWSYPLISACRIHSEG